MASKFVSGFVSILGRPNVGKSTLLNALIGSKIAIVADKPQTTRSGIQGVLSAPEGQIVFVDTPGIHQAKSPINRRMMESVRQALQERDLFLYLVDVTQRFSESDRYAVDMVKRSSTPAFLILNKVDLLKEKELILPAIDKYRTLHDFAGYLPISAKNGTGLEGLKTAILSRLPAGPAYFPPGHITDQPERFLASELIREKIIRETREEVPYSVAVMIDAWEESPRLTRIRATVYVDREGQKGILIGAKGGVLKTIGTLARIEMESLFSKKIYLDLHVKARPKWRDNKDFLNTLDWRTMAGADEA